MTTIARKHNLVCVDQMLLHSTHTHAFDFDIKPIHRIDTTFEPMCWMSSGFKCTPEDVIAGNAILEELFPKTLTELPIANSSLSKGKSVSFAMYVFTEHLSYCLVRRSDKKGMHMNTVLPAHKLLMGTPDSTMNSMFPHLDDITPVQAIQFACRYNAYTAIENNEPTSYVLDWSVKDAG